MRKITFLKTLLLAMILLVGSANVWSADELAYTISFENSVTTDGTTAVTTSDFISKLVTTGATYISSCTSTNNAYVGKGGAKLSSSSVRGKFVLDLSTSGKVNATKIVVNASQWTTDTEKIKVNGTTTGNLTATPTDYEFTLDGSELTSISVESVTKRAYIYYIKVYVAGAPTTTPTITVTEVTVPAMSAQVGSTDTKTITVSGINLTQNIGLALSGTNADQFSLSPNSVTQTAGTAPNTTVTITYTPTAQGSHTATLTLTSAGATSVTRELSGTAVWAPLTTPVATDANAQNTSGFTANWNAVSGATEYQLDVYTKTGGSISATDLIISEYVEGSSNNKAIEIFNGTGSAVNLSSYSLFKQTNGAGSYVNEQTLSGTLANNHVFVSVNTSSSTAILALSDVNNNSTMTFNGNDAVALYKNGVQIDEVGIFNQTTDWGKDVTLIRKSSVLSPKVPYDATDWDSNATDFIDNLGMHTMNISSSSTTPVSGSPFTVSGTNSKAITGLSASNTYYYTVVAKNSNVTSSVSNEIAASTLGTGLNSSKELNLTASNGQIRFSAASGETVEVFNAIGQKLIGKTAVEGLNIISVQTHGVLLVKIGDRLAKVIL